MGLGAERVGDHQAAVHRDAAEQVDADVHVRVVEEASYTAGRDTQLPVVVLSVIIHPEGHGKEEKQVRDGQVEKEDAQNILPAHLLPNGANCQHIEDQAKDKSQNVDRHQEVTDWTVDVDVYTCSIWGCARCCRCGIEVHFSFCFLSLLWLEIHLQT